MTNTRNDLLGNEQLQKQYKDSDKRYEQGDPSEGYSDQEVLKRYGEVSHAVPPDQYAQAAKRRWPSETRPSVNQVLGEIADAQSHLAGSLHTAEHAQSVADAVRKLSDPATEQNVQNKMTAGPKQRIFSISGRRFK